MNIIACVWRLCSFIATRTTPETTFWQQEPEGPGLKYWHWWDCFQVCHNQSEEMKSKSSNKTGNRTICPQNKSIYPEMLHFPYTLHETGWKVLHISSLLGLRLCTVQYSVGRKDEYTSWRSDTWQNDDCYGNAMVVNLFPVWKRGNVSKGGAKRLHREFSDITCFFAM